MRKRALAFMVLLLTAPLFAEESLQEVTVAPGDTMWNIANKYLKDPQKWPEIVKVNNLPTADPTIALPGTRIKIPVSLIREEYRTAQIINLIPEVRYKRRDDADFKTAINDMTLRYEDSLRTMSGGQARVRFPSKEIVQINENSYVVLKPEKIMQEVQLLQGDLRASRAKVIMPGGTIVNPQSGKSEFQARVREDETEVVFVYKGEVNVTAKGKTVHVKEGFGTQVPKSAPPIEPMPLASFKDFNPKDYTAPVMKTSIPIQPSNKPINFTPPKPVAAPTVPPPGNNSKSKSVVAQNILTNYRVQLAKDEKFSQILLEKTEVTATSFNIKSQSLPDGRYYMRVAFLDALGVQSGYSEPSIIIKDTKPPELTVMRPAEGQSLNGDSYCDVSGNATDAVSLSVNGEVVFLGTNGSFSTTAFLKPGANTIRIVARDSNRNETILERHVTYTK